jgi:NAD(P)-dependent dehydrogenase (short-subunit alcohol dehydrogenase family)
MSTHQKMADDAAPAMSEPRSVVITGASRGLGLAAAVDLYRRGWRVVAAMRSPDSGMQRLRETIGARDDDPRLIGVQLDLQDPASVASAAKAIEAAIGAPDALVHNAGIAVVGAAEETPIPQWEQIFAIHVLGPVALTQALLPSMRAAGRGRIVMISSEGGVRGMPAIAAYSASKGALERWAEAMAGEVAAFGIGVTVIVTGTFDTDILTETGMSDYRNFDGPYARHYDTITKRGQAAMRFAGPPEQFARCLSKALGDRGPFTRHAAGIDARMLLIGNRFLSGRSLHRVIRVAMGLPRFGALRDQAPTPTAENELSKARQQRG